MKRNLKKRILALALAATVALPLISCGGNNAPAEGSKKTEGTEDTAVEGGEQVSFPLAEKMTFKGLTSFPVNTESEPNNRTIFKRLEEKTNVHIDWTAISSDQWGEKISLVMSDVNAIPEFVFNAGFSNNDLIKYADQEIIIPIEEYIDQYMPNLKKVYEAYPEYRAMSEDENGHIWALPWIEQLGSGKTAIQTVEGMSFINKKWLDFLKLEMPTTTEELEAVLQSFKDNAAKLQAEFNIDGDIIPMSFIINHGGEDPAIIMNGFGEGYGDPDRGRHIAVTEDGKVISTATQEGFRDGLRWMNSLYEKGLIDAEAFTHEWATYVAKGKSGRYGLAFSWDIANIDNLEDWTPLPAIKADTLNITPNNGSFTSGFDRGRAVITAAAKDPGMLLAWFDQMYDPLQSPQNNWGTYGEDDEFDIFVMDKNEEGEPMLKHAKLGDASPVEVREAEAVGGPLAILDEYYGKYVTTPDDAQYRLDWIKDIYTKDMNTKNIYPNVFMNAEDSQKLVQLETDLSKHINSSRADWIMNGLSDAQWEQYLADLDNYRLNDYLEILQKYYDAFKTSQE